MASLHRYYESNRKIFAEGFKLVKNVLDEIKSEIITPADDYIDYKLTETLPQSTCAFFTHRNRETSAANNYYVPLEQFPDVKFGLLNSVYSFSEMEFKSGDDDEIIATFTNYQ